MRRFLPNGFFAIGLLLPVLSLSCSSSLPLTEEEEAYLASVRSVSLPLRMTPEEREIVISRAVDWINRFSVYPIRSRGENFVETAMPGSGNEGGVGYRIEANDLDEVLTVEITALRPNSFGGRGLVSDPFIEAMVGLYVRDGILPPNDRTGFEETRR